MMIKSGMLALGLLAAPAMAAENLNVELFKTPDCTCCEGYAEHLRRAGFTVTVKATPDLAGMTAVAGVPLGLEGCHLTFVDGYIVSGHVPIATVQRLLAERPDVAGITLPGMPLGSPGVDGERTEPFTMYAFGDGAAEVFAVE